MNGCRKMNRFGLSLSYSKTVFDRFIGLTTLCTFLKLGPRGNYYIGIGKASRHVDMAHKATKLCIVKVPISHTCIGPAIL